MMVAHLLIKRMNHLDGVGTPAPRPSCSGGDGSGRDPPRSFHGAIFRMASSHGDAIEFSLRNSPTGREPGFTGVIAVADAGGVPGVVFRVPAGIAARRGRLCASVIGIILVMWCR